MPRTTAGLTVLAAIALAACGEKGRRPSPPVPPRSPRRPSPSPAPLPARRSPPRRPRSPLLRCPTPRRRRRSAMATMPRRWASSRATPATIPTMRGASTCSASPRGSPASTSARCRRSTPRSRSTRRTGRVSSTRRACCSRPISPKRRWTGCRRRSRSSRSRVMVCVFWAGRRQSWATSTTRWTPTSARSRSTTQDVWAMNNLGYIYIQQGRSDAALPPLARAVEIRSNVPVFQNNLGMALERSGPSLGGEDGVRDRAAGGQHVREGVGGPGAGHRADRGNRHGRRWIWRAVEAVPGLDRAVADGDGAAGFRRARCRREPTRRPSRDGEG